MENKEYQIVDSVEKLEAALARVRAAQKKNLRLTRRKKSTAFFLRRPARPTSSVCRSPNLR